VIKVKHYEIAGTNTHTVEVIKPNLVFGLKPNKGLPPSLWTSFS